MSNVAFGASIDVLTGSAVDTTATATINCNGGTNNAVFRFCLDITRGADFTGTQRRMASGANRVNFDLYKNAARTQPWGNYTTPFLGGGSQFDLTTNGSGNIVNATRTVFARLPGSQQAAVPGAYTESMPVSTSNDLQYNTTASTATACPTGNRTQTYAFTVTATVIPACNIGATTHSFGSSGVLVSNVDATSTLTATCTSMTPYNVGLDAGTGAGATVATRKMTSGGNTINYSLYTNSARTTVWGNTVGTDTVAGTGSGLGQGLTVYGRVPAQTTPTPATYSDTIITTVTY